MGLLIDGVWHDVWYDTAATEGKFERSAAKFRNWVKADGSTDFLPEANRYHLYISHACPWAHRTLIFRALKGLEDVISFSAVDYLMKEEGWTFYGTSGNKGDGLYGLSRMSEIYTKANPTYSGRVTVPVLWDKKHETIVSNESSEIIRMLNSEFNAFAKNPDLDLYPSDLQAEIDEINAFVYDTVNNGVYKSGFATTQNAYEEAVVALFAALDQLDGRLAKSRYLVGSRITEADWRLFTTLLRFDPVYVSHFKCNLKRLRGYPNLWHYLLELYQVPKIAETVNMEHIKGHYFKSHDMINPTGVVPKGPEVDYTAPHNRHHL